MGDRIVKSISFKMSDRWECDLLDHCKQYGNFSNYVKRLIQRDKEGAAPASPITTESAGMDAKEMESFF